MQKLLSGGDSAEGAAAADEVANALDSLTVKAEAEAVEEPKKEEKEEA